MIHQMASRLHMRRCHKCHHVNVADAGNLVHKCEACGKSLAPFYYFDESRAVGLKSEQEAAEEYKSSALPWREYPPVFGLTVYWEFE